MRPSIYMVLDVEAWYDGGTIDELYLYSDEINSFCIYMYLITFVKHGVIECV